MSAVTLEILRADFEAARNVMADEMRERGLGSAIPMPERIADTRRYMASCPRDALISRRYPGRESWENAHGLGEEWQRMMDTATLCVIAEEHGLQAAMLYKLSDGAIDPREVQP